MSVLEILFWSYLSIGQIFVLIFIFVLLMKDKFSEEKKIKADELVNFSSMMHPAIVYLGIAILWPLVFIAR